MFSWKVVPSWNNYIARADVSVTLPGAGCSVGVGTEEKGCATVDVAGNTLRHGAMESPLRPDPGTEPDRRAVGRGSDAGRGGGGVPVVAIELRQGAGIPDPVLTAGGDRPDALTATLLHLAEHGLIKLHQVNEKRWTITGIADHAAWDEMDSVSRNVGHALDVSRPDGEFNANGTVKAGRRLATARTDLGAAVIAWGLRERLLRAERSPAANWLRWTGVLALVTSIAGFASWGFPSTIWGLPFVAFFLCSTPAWRSDAGVRRTEDGRRLWAQAEGFHRLIATDSAETRFDFAARKDLFTTYLAYAVVAGLAALWARKYATATGSAAPEPNWYHSTAADTTTAGFASAGLGGFESVVFSSISAHSAAQSSSFGASGGGYGGGGGGGGGSW